MAVFQCMILAAAFEASWILLDFVGFNSYVNFNVSLLKTSPSLSNSSSSSPDDGLFDLYNLPSLPSLSSSFKDSSSSLFAPLLGSLALSSVQCSEYSHPFSNDCQTIQLRHTQQQHTSSHLGYVCKPPRAV
jgi:hypothetical protein